MRRASTGVALPLGVVLNTNRPGIEFVPGVPSTDDNIDVAGIKVLPSSPVATITPRDAPLEVIAPLEFIVLLKLLLKIRLGAVPALELQLYKPRLEELAEVPCPCTKGVTAALAKFFVATAAV